MNLKKYIKTLLLMVVVVVGWCAIVMNFALFLTSNDTGTNVAFTIATISPFAIPFLMLVWAIAMGTIFFKFKWV